MSAKDFSASGVPGYLRALVDQGRDSRRLTRVAVFIGLLSIVGSAVAGFFAYAHSRKVIRETVLANNLNLARIMRAHAEMGAQLTDTKGTLADLNAFWERTRKPSESSSLCVIGGDGRLLLNTKRPGMVGTNVGHVPIPAGDALGITNVFGLLSTGLEWVGCNRSHAGEAQAAAYSYVPSCDFLVAVHIPESELATEVRATSLPWAVGWGFIALVLMPAALAMLLRASTASQRSRDIALRKLKLAEQEVRQSRDFLSTALNEFPLLIWRAGTDSKCNYVNQTWLNFTGRLMDQEMGDGWLESVHPEDRGARVHCFDMAFQAREPFNMEYRLQRRDGTYRWMADWGRPLLTRDGAFEGYIGGCQDITQRRETESVLRQQRIEREMTNERLHTLSRRLMEIQESERHHLARELHDEIGQLLTITRINLQALREAPESIGLASRLDDSIAVVDRLLEQIRHLSLDLRPPLLDDLGLKAAVRWYVNQQAARSDLQIRFLAKLGDERFDPSVETACFRVIQEAVTNIIRHANATHAAVEIVREGKALRLTVMDDGVGFDVAEIRANAAQGASFGLISIEERLGLVGGRLILSSTPGHGTQIVALVSAGSPQASLAPAAGETALPETVGKA